MKVLPVLALSALVFCLSAAEAKEKKSDEYYWDTTGLSTQLMLNNFKMFDKKNCYSNQQTFRGCIFALNAIGGFATPPVKVIPSNLVKEPALQIDQVLSSSYGLSVASISQEARAKTNQTMAQIWEVQKNLRKKTDSEIANLYKFSVFTKTDFEALFKEVAKVALMDRTKDSMIAGEAISAFLREQLNDAHARLTPKAQLNDDLGNAGESFFGIGATLQKLEEEIIVMEPVKGGPADRGGLKPNDILVGIKLFSLEEIEKKVTKEVQVQIDGFYSLRGLKLEKVVELIKGPEGTRLDLKIKRQGKDVVLTLSRGKVSIKNVETRMVNELGRKYGHISIRTFMDNNLCSTLEKALVSFENSGAEGIILDLRRNGGGLLDQAVCMGGLFLGREVIVQVKDLKSERMEPRTAKSKKVTNLPLVTVIDQASASASEVLSGALRDHKRSLIVGVRSFGKGTVQAPQLFYNDKTYFFKTIQRFYQPGGTTNQLVGISPDIEVSVKPDATAEEAFALREGDIFPSALDAIGPQYKQVRSSEMEKISHCLNQGKLARHEYARGKAEGRAIDYQLLTAQEALACQAR